jgi:hypothetical protein
MPVLKLVAGALAHIATKVVVLMIFNSLLYASGTYKLFTFHFQKVRGIFACSSLKKYLLLFLTVMCAASRIIAQDLDPRAYVQIPVGVTNLVTGFVYSYGGVVVDPSIPIKNIDADVESFSLGVAHSFNLAGLSAQAMVAVPYSLAQVSGEVNERDSSISRSGFGDTRVRLSVLFLGAPAATLQEMRQAKARKTVMGASVNIVAPTGQFFSDKLINLGTNRWGFRPELALSQPIGKKWLADVYAGLWLFTDNNSFYPGQSSRTQAPMGSFQGHISYNFKANLWVAINATFYTGGASSIDGVVNDDRQSNMRIGWTVVLPTGKLSSIKLAGSTGAIVRIGQDFTTLSIGWQKAWFSKAKK